VLTDAKEAGIKVFLFDRMLDVSTDLYEAAVVSDMANQGRLAMEWLLAQNLPEYNVIHIQGAMGSDAQIGRTGAFDAEVAAGRMNKVMQQTATWDEAAAKAIVESVIASGDSFNIIYAENDGMAKGAVAALQDAGIPHGTAEGGVIIIGVDANKWALREVLAGNWNLNVQCSPFQADVIHGFIQKLEAGQSINVPANKKVISSWAITGTDFIEASMRGNTVYVTAESVLAAVASGRQAWTTVKLTATVENGAAPNQNYTQDFYVTFVVPVTGMTMDSAFVLAGNTKDINDFNPVVAPANAGWYEHTALGWVVWADGLEWSMVPGQDMAGAVSIDPVTGLIDATAATAAGTVKVRATIPGGAGRKSVGGEPGCNDFVDISFDFTVNVIVPLNDIIGIPAKWNAGKVLDLASVPYMDPPAAGFYATDIVWSIDPLGTDATISTAGKLNVSAASVIAAGTNEPDSWLTVALINDAKDVNDFLPVVLPERRLRRYPGHVGGVDSR